MKIKQVDRRKPVKEKEYDRGAKFTGHEGATPLAPVDKTRFSSNHPYFKDRKEWNRQTKQARRRKTMRKGEVYEASPHTMWIRKDIWEALKIYKSREHRSLRSCVEEALYDFLIKKGRVTEVEDLGEDAETASWKV